MNGPKFQIFKDPLNKQFRYHLQSADGDNILSGDGFVSIRACLDNIAFVKNMAPYNSRYDRKDAYYNYTFVLKSLNDDVIGRSKSYRSSAARDNGVEAVKRDAPAASVEDLTRGS